MTELGQTRTRFGVMTYLKKDHFVGACYASGKHWEENFLVFLSKALDKNKNALDIGTHIGSHTIPYAQGSRFVYSFEPQRELFRVLQKNIIQNGITNVVAQCAAVSYKAGTAHIGFGVGEMAPNADCLSYTDGKSRNYGGVQLTAEGIEVPQVTVPHVKDISLIKIDVEGFEPVVLYTLQNMILESKPVITFERNWKAIGDKLVGELGIPDEIANFSIENFTRQNGYGPVLVVDNDHNLLLCYNHDCLRKLLGTWNTILGTSTVSEAGNAVYEIFLEEGDETRGPYRVVSLSETKVVMFVATGCDLADCSTYFAAELDGDTLRWENNTTWTRA